VAAEQKLALFIPDDFYARVRQSDEAPKPKASVDVLGLPKTEMLCYNGEFAFRGKILAIKDGWVVLDRTAFYAESGGQVSDEGTLAGQSVTAVKKEAGVILHQVPRPGQLKVGETISGQVLADRRRQIMAHHTGAHVLNAAAREVLGPHICSAARTRTSRKPISI